METVSLVYDGNYNAGRDELSTLSLLFIIRGIHIANKKGHQITQIASSYLNWETIINPTEEIFKDTAFNTYEIKRKKRRNFSS